MMARSAGVVSIAGRRAVTRVFWITTLVCYSGAVGWASLSPVSEGSVLGGTWPRRTVNNLLHVPAYALLAGVVYIALRLGGHARHTIRGLLVAGGIAVVFGSAMELVQAFVPGRWPGLTDITLDAAGAALFVGFVWIRRRGLTQQRRV